MSCPACQAQRQANHHQARADRLAQTLRELANQIERIREDHRTHRQAARLYDQLAHDQPHDCHRPARSSTHST